MRRRAKSRAQGAKRGSERTPEGFSMNSQGSNDPWYDDRASVALRRTLEGFPNADSGNFAALDNPSRVDRKRGRRRFLTGGFVPQPPAIRGEPLRGSSSNGSVMSPT